MCLSQPGDVDNRRPVSQQESQYIQYISDYTISDTTVVNMLELESFIACMCIHRHSHDVTDHVGKHMITRIAQSDSVRHRDSYSQPTRSCLVSIIAALGLL